MYPSKSLKVYYIVMVFLEATLCEQIEYENVFDLHKTGVISCKFRHILSDNNNITSVSFYKNGVKKIYT